MRTFAKSRIRYSKSQRLGIFAFILLIVIFQIFNWILNSSNPSSSHSLEIPPEVLSIYSPENSSHSTEKSALSKFNPNHLTSEEWMNLGFSEKQVATILKYKYSLGGNFSNKEEIQSCFVISESKFSEIEPYLIFDDIYSVSLNQSNYKESYSSNSSSNSTIKIQYSKFDPNDYSAQDWQKIGFSEKQAQSIIKYKFSLGGEFTSLHQIETAYVISEEKFLEMKPFILFKKNSNKISTHENPTFVKLEQKKESIGQRPSFNPNKLSQEEWMELGFSEKQSATILKFKNSLGGSFPDAETLSRCYVISEEKFKELEPYLDFDR